MSKIVEIKFDDASESCPSDYDCNWLLVSFKRNSIHYKPITTYLNSAYKFLQRNMLTKHKQGLLFFVQYYEHGSGRYDLQGEGPNCRFDTAKYGGILFWPHKKELLGAVTIEERKKDARLFLKLYNEWMNGEVYNLTIYEKRKGENVPIDGCAGLFADYLTDTIVTMLDPHDSIEITGNAAHAFDESKLPKHIKLNRKANAENTNTAECRPLRVCAL